MHGILSCFKLLILLSFSLHKTLPSVSVRVFCNWNFQCQIDSNDPCSVLIFSTSTMFYFQPEKSKDVPTSKAEMEQSDFTTEYDMNTIRNIDARQFNFKYILGAIFVLAIAVLLASLLSQYRMKVHEDWICHWETLLVSYLVLERFFEVFGKIYQPRFILF